MISDLVTKACVSCRDGVAPLKGAELAALEKQVDRWNVIEEHHLAKIFRFPDFREALKFVNRVGELAEEQGHHPDLWLANCYFASHRACNDQRLGELHAHSPGSMEGAPASGYRLARELAVRDQIIPA